MGVLTLPALADAHVHLREPGGTQKEDFGSGTRAALAGGMSVVLDMPNTKPPTVDRATLSEKAGVAAQKAHCDYGLFVGATEGNAAACAALGERAAGLKIYAGPTYGPLMLSELPALMAHFAAWRGPGPIAVHAEGPMMAVAIALARAYRRPTHLCHVSRAHEIELIGRSKADGARITCEVTPHHLFLTEDDAVRLGPFGQMKPALASASDVAALWRHLDVVDIFATDHAPHTRQEKLGENPPPGVPGVETMLPLLLTAVAEGRLTLADVVSRLHEGPARVFGLRLPPAETVIDDAAVWEIGSGPLLTRCGWTPFAGMPARGRVVSVTVRGQPAFRDGVVLAPAGSGRNVREYQ
jgi:carbamoyl-phosphate synthase/aspartate carbamoyltransferase/dihydroorotase